MQSVDVAIVGGGPAGSRAGEAAAANGADAVILEKGVPRADRPRLGPDSTDAAGMLDYWVDILGIPFSEIPDEIILRELGGSQFIGPTEVCALTRTGIEASYDGFGFTFHRARMDDWLRERAEDAGAEYRVGTSVASVESDVGSNRQHVLTMADGEEIAATYLICADGPQRTVTLPVLDQYLPEGRASESLGPRRANHIAYQEYRQIPDEIYEPDQLKFWWGYIPGDTAYPWVFPNDGNVARVGLTMPMGIDLETIPDREDYVLIESTDDTVPSGAVYLERLLEYEYGDAYDIESDFPLVDDRGKQDGREAYAISSTRPIDSPTAANIAIAGGAMGTTSAFHEGGYHVAARSGAIAGELAAKGNLSRYNAAWKHAIGDEILRNVSFAEIVESFGPGDWDRAFRLASRMLGDESSGGRLIQRRVTAGMGALGYLLRYRWIKRRYRNGGYVQLHESEYTV